MHVFVSGATATVRALHPHPNLGVLVTPHSRQSMSWVAGSGIPWGADNGCYRMLDVVAIERMLDAIRRIPNCRFVAVPDVVGDHAATRTLWQEWYPALAHAALPAAFVLQDGATSATVPWHQCRALFLGGSTAYKRSAEARQLCLEAKARGLWVHVGRVNSAKRERAIAPFADSFDGGQYSMFPDRHLPPCLIRLSAAQHGVPTLPAALPVRASRPHRSAPQQLTLF